MLVCWLIVCVCVCLGSCYICKWQSIWPSGSERTYNLPRPGQQCIHLPRRGTGSHCGWDTSHNWRNVPESFTGLYSTVQYSTVQCVSLDTHCLVGTRSMRIISQDNCGIAHLTLYRGCLPSRVMAWYVRYEVGVLKLGDVSIPTEWPTYLLAITHDSRPYMFCRMTNENKLLNWSMISSFEPLIVLAVLCSVSAGVCYTGHSVSQLVRQTVDCSVHWDISLWIYGIMALYKSRDYCY